MFDFIAVDARVAGHFLVPTVSASVQQPLVYFIFLRVQHIIAIVEEKEAVREIANETTSGDITTKPSRESSYSPFSAKDHHLLASCKYLELKL